MTWTHSQIGESWHRGGSFSCWHKRSGVTSSAWVSRGDDGNTKVKLLSWGTNTRVTLLAPEEKRRVASTLDRRPCHMWEDCISSLYYGLLHTKWRLYFVKHRPAYICTLALWTKYQRLHTSRVPVSYKSELNRLRPCQFRASSWRQISRILFKIRNTQADPLH